MGLASGTIKPRNISPGTGKRAVVSIAALNVISIVAIVATLVEPSDGVIDRTDNCWQNGVFGITTRIKSTKVNNKNLCR